MEKMGTLKTNGDQKTHFGPHGDQSPQMGTNVGAVEVVGFQYLLLPCVPASLLRFSGWKTFDSTVQSFTWLFGHEHWSGTFAVKNQG